MAHDRSSASVIAWRSPAWVLVGPLALAATYFLAVHAVPKLTLSAAVYGEYYWPRRYWLLAHVISGLFATLGGSVQFLPSLRRSRPRLHRLMGRLYLVSVVVSAAMALYLAATSAITVSYAVGLVVIAVLWLVTAAFAYTHAVARRIALHREWMIRNYVVTLFFIIFFGFYDLFTALQVGSPELIASLGVWLCSAGPLAATELILHRRRAVSPARRAMPV